MTRESGSIARGAAMAAALTLVLAPLAPAAAAPAKKRPAKAVALTEPFGSFTPAAVDPRAASSFARAGVDMSGFRFTPSAAPGSRKAVTVAVRAQRTNLNEAKSLAEAPVVVTPITPTAYSLGASVGWKRFAVTGEFAKVDTGLMPGARESADVAVSYGGKNWSTRVVLGADRADGAGPALIGVDEGYSVDLGGSVSLTRNLAVTGGMRYRMARDRVEPLSDLRRDSQAVYLGTAFRF